MSVTICYFGVSQTTRSHSKDAKVLNAANATNSVANAASAAADDVYTCYRCSLLLRALPTRCL